MDAYICGGKQKKIRSVKKYVRFLFLNINLQLRKPLVFSSNSISIPTSSNNSSSNSQLSVVVVVVVVRSSSSSSSTLFFY